MKKNIIMLFAVIALAVIGFTYRSEAVVYAKNVFSVMQSERSNEILHPGAMVKSHYRFASTTEASVCTGKCAIFDIIMNSGADGAYAIVYDSAPATAGTTTLIGRVEFDGTGKPTSLAAGNSNAFPIVTTLGIGIDLSSVAGNEEVLVLYKDLD